MIEEGEHLQQDFKLRVDDPHKIAKTIAAFANSEGGRLLIGVRDSGAYRFIGGAESLGRRGEQ